MNEEGGVVSEDAIREGHLERPAGGGEHGGALLLLSPCGGTP